MSNKQSDILQNEYQLRFEKNNDYRNNVWKILCNNYFKKYVPFNSKILDLGAGWGEFINNIETETKFAMDLNPDTKMHLLDQIKFIHQDCSSKWELKENSLDIVFTSNFLEHLPDKAHVEETISEVYRCLKDNGLFILLGPNIKYTKGEYWDFWDHYIPLTELSISELLKMKNFKINKCIPRFLPYSMSSGKNPPLLFLKMYLKLPILWPLFGKQFFIIAQK